MYGQWFDRNVQIVAILAFVMCSLGGKVASGRERAGLSLAHQEPAVESEPNL